ncbi:hypothetical protein [Bacillus pumilus]|uniref:hypothetical protein n=2 Tax=Bacillus pumilus TaxID=1408 RepID=UPI00227DEF9C|nr:hypothetical protein [Bacillus pumilus]MCY7500233.1 hypothetical protein [Bacillus pumilus]MCY7528443.1 hypothetical protein [Bacillus pumilus]MED4490042.1 hypothetical protein [Bacillus pumilus]
MLNLHNLKGAYQLKNQGGDFAYFYNEKSNNLIVINNIDDEEIRDVTDNTSQDAYMYLTNKLNIETNLTVIWYKTEFDSSDYILAEDVNGKELLHLDLIDLENTVLGDKYKFDKKYVKFIEGDVVELKF